jgi:hypothetical protein
MLPDHRLRQKIVSFYAPAFNDIEYRIALPVDDYVTGFQVPLPKMNGA